MNLFKDVRNYILEEKFKIIYLEGKLNLINYSSVLSFDSEKIIINCENKVLEVKGENLVISKILIDELLIEGNIKKIEFR